MGRVVTCLLVVLAFIVLTEHRLSDGQPRRASDPPPEIWDPVYHSNAVMHAAPAATCALVLSLDRASPYTLTSPDEGVRFDIDGDGDLEQVAWTPGGSDVAFLAIDQDGDGRITSGSELMTSRSSPGKARSAPDALGTLATKAVGGDVRGLLDSRNPLFPRLLLWTDTNHNGISEPAELRPAPQVLSGIGLGFSRHHRKDRHGNESRYRGFVRVRPEQVTPTAPTSLDDARPQRSMYDVCLMTN